MNALADALKSRAFFWSLEFIPSVDRILRDDLRKLGGIAQVMKGNDLLVSFAVTDRVISERDPEPVAAAASLLDATGKQPLVHFSGKGREPADLDHAISRMRANGLQNTLVITGDRLKTEPPEGRAHYLESVCAIQRIRQQEPGWLIAAALNPFKYCEEDGMAQYLKLGKKVRAGANCVITQIGFDARKYSEAAAWISGRALNVPIVANVLLLTAARARHMRAYSLPGITITDSLMRLLEDDARVSSEHATSRALRRLALQIVGVELAGFAGVQITGLHAPEKVEALERAVETANEECPNFEAWEREWTRALTDSDARVAEVAPESNDWALGDERKATASMSRRAKYQLMRKIHSAVFESGPLAHVIGNMVRPLYGREREPSGRVLHAIERAIKRPLLGCDTCGMCRLAATQYVCPETCPKGLANGACGGTTENRCEFGDRECIHSVKYRIARAEGIEQQLEEWLVPAVPPQRRHTTSWPAHFAGKGPEVKVIHIYPRSIPTS